MFCVLNTYLREKENINIQDAFRNQTLQLKNKSVSKRKQQLKHITKNHQYMKSSFAKTYNSNLIG